MASSRSAIPKRSLGAIIDSVPTQVDSIPDSCSEASSSDDDDDNHHAILPTPRPIPLTQAPMHRSVVETGKGKQRAAGTGDGQSPKVEVSVGIGGKMVYSTVEQDQQSQYFSVQWRKPQTKKHKTWDGDAYIKVTGHRVLMFDADGNQKAAGSINDKTYLEPEVEFRLGGLDVGIDSVLSQQEFKANTTCLKRMNKLANVEMTTSAAYRPAQFAKPFRTPIQIHKPKPMAGYIPARTSESETIDSPSHAGPSRSAGSMAAEGTPTRAISSKSFYSTSGSASKSKSDRIVLGEKSNKERLEWGGALHNPNEPDAVVMQRPKDSTAQIKKTEIVDVVVDPILASRMRDHQKEGVKFMYSCIMGLTNAESEGCILADEMGLGKTLQTIALIYTLLKQSPFANQSSLVHKAVIVCPKTLVDNWRKEFKKWVDRRVSVVVADGADSRISTFINNKTQQVLVIGYERFRKVSKQLAACQPPIDLVVCDEGHRLKSKDNKLVKSFDELRTTRRIILSGTPVQNDLGEYWAMSHFVCPGLLGKYSAFCKQFEKPILKSREQRCSAAELIKGQDASEELSKLSKEYVLRRTADVLNQYLPPKFEYVLFVAPSLLQLQVFARILNPATVGGCLSGYGVQSLALIDMLRKVASSPMLLKKKDEMITKDSDIASLAQQALEVVPASINKNDVRTSGKMMILDQMLQSIRNSQEKVVVVSNWTTTLDLIEGLLKIKKYSFLRLDGSTAQNKRQDNVDLFNRGSIQDSFVFLLSAKAGGAGINLIGASRLILFDSDWNPSTDQQAMARIHRDGQKRPVFIYRLLTTNTIDEKIYQRQITKTGLSNQMMDQGGSTEKSKDSFSAAELKDIFTLNYRTDGCQTHDLLGCDCARKKKKHPAVDLDGDLDDDDDDNEEKARIVSASQYDPEPTPKMLRKAALAQKEKLATLKDWKHFDCYQKSQFSGVADQLVYQIIWDAWEDDVNADSGVEIEAAHKKKKQKIVDPDDDEEEEQDRSRVIGTPGMDSDEDGSTTITSRSKFKSTSSTSKRNGDNSRNRSRTDTTTTSEDGFTDVPIPSEEDFDNAMLANMFDDDDDNDRPGVIPVEDDEEDDDVVVPSKRKSRNTSNTKEKSKGGRGGGIKLRSSGEEDPVYGVKKHNINDIAQNGGGGRIMFLFEKKSDSQL